jgi:hypothetical protein
LHYACGCAQKKKKKQVARRVVVSSMKFNARCLLATAQVPKAYSCAFLFCSLRSWPSHKMRLSTTTVVLFLGVATAVTDVDVNDLRVVPWNAGDGDGAARHPLGAPPPHSSGRERTVEVAAPKQPAQGNMLVVQVRVTV